MIENLKKLEEKAEKLGKEFLYVGHYVDVDGNYILKIGTTNRLRDRQSEHTRNYKKAKKYQMPKDAKFVYDYVHMLGRYNTVRYEDKNRSIWQELGIGEFVRNDRFCCAECPKVVNITIKKTYAVALGE